MERGKLRFQRVVFLRIFLRHLLIAVLRDSAEGVVLIELVQHLVNLFKARRDLRDTLLLLLGLVGLLHGKVLFAYPRTEGQQDVPENLAAAKGTLPSPGNGAGIRAGIDCICSVGAGPGYRDE